MSLNKPILKSSLWYSQLKRLHQGWPDDLEAAPDLDPNLIQMALTDLTQAAETLEARFEELHRIEQELWIERQRFQDFFEFTPVSFLITSKAGKVLEVNQASSRLLCLPQPMIVGRFMSEFVDPSDLVRLSNCLQLAASGQATHLLLTLSTRRSGELAVEVEISPAFNLQGQLIHLRWLIRETSRNSTAEQRLDHQLLYAALTGLPNRISFIQQLDQTIKKRSRSSTTTIPLVLLYLDLDGFKHVNNSFGHHAGDQLLIIIAQRLLACMRPNDLVARLGGDEFAILLEHVQDEAGAIRISDRLHQALVDPIELDGYRISISASIGVAINHLLADSVSTAEIMIGNADMAMCQAKTQSNSHTGIFNDSLRPAQAEQLMVMRTEFQEALKRQEFLLYYQPIMNIHTGRCSGVEALVRWQHPRLGLVSYDCFLAVARRTKALNQLERWIFLQACQEVKGWLDCYPLDENFQLHINVSAHRLADANFIDEVALALSSTQFPPQNLTIELTENSLIDDCEQMAIILEKLRSMEIKISLDDFGSGYSSLSHLCRFPISEIKIDPLFIRNLYQNDRLSEIVNNTIHLGQDLHLNIIAEGIETEGQLDFLVNAGCRLGQGFLFSKPMASQHMAELLGAS
jgi:diguanylate cyclase (GGDEF)-like protein/PAS domain S-box-containing protein